MMNRADFLKRGALGLGVVAALPLLPLVPGVPKSVKALITKDVYYTEPGISATMVDLFPGDSPFIQMIKRGELKKISQGDPIFPMFREGWKISETEYIVGELNASKT